MINFLKLKFLNVLYFLHLKNKKVLRMNSHNNDIKVSYLRKLKVYRKETQTNYGRKLIKNEIDGLTWISKKLKTKNKDLDQFISYGTKKIFVDIKEIKGEKIDFTLPLTITESKIFRFIDFYKKTWPQKKKVPCHGDLTFDNVIFSKHGIKIIDWECFYKKGEFWGYDLAYLILSAATFPYYKYGKLPFKDQQILKKIWKRLKSIGINKKILTDPIPVFKNRFRKKHWKMIINRSPKKLFPMLINKSFYDHLKSVIK